MSAEATAWAKRQTTGDATRKAILRALADYAGPGKADRDAPAEADGRHFTFVGVETIAEECECSERTVIRHLNELKARSMIIRVRRMRGFIRTSDYTILACDSNGERPFTDAEALLADGLGAADDSVASAQVTPEDANLADDTLASTDGCQIEQGKVTRAAPTDHDAGVICVPYAGTTSNTEPRAELPAARGRDDFSPGFMIESGGVSSGHTLATVGEKARQQRAEQRATEEEIMSKFASWLLAQTGAVLPASEQREIRKQVSVLLGDGVSRADVAYGLGEWAMSETAYSPRSIPSFVSQSIRRRLPRSQARPATKAEERQQRLSEAVRAATGGGAELLDTVRQQSLKAGFGGGKILAAIEGVIA